MLDEASLEPEGIPSCQAPRETSADTITHSICLPAHCWGLSCCPTGESFALRWAAAVVNVVVMVNVAHRVLL